jgi:hypothetical protein
MTGTGRPHFYILEDTTASTSWLDHATGFKQAFHMLELHKALAQLLAHPRTEYRDIAAIAIHILITILENLETIGPMSEEYMRKLFSMGEQALRYLVASESRRYGGRKVDFAALDAEGEGYSGKRTTSQKDKKHMRRHVLYAAQGELFGRPADSIERLREVPALLQMCAGWEGQVKCYGLGSVVLPTPKTKTKTERVTKTKGSKRDEKWEDEMHFVAMKALQALGQTLSERFMCWPVEIDGKVVAGTGRVTGEVIKGWVFHSTIVGE